MMPSADLTGDAFEDATFCDVCGRESCEDHLPNPDVSDRPAIAERYPDFVDRLRSRTVPADVIPNLIPGAGITMAHGHPRSLKTWVLQEIARATSTCGEAFGLAQFRATEPYNTWRITEEDGETEEYARFAALFAGRDQAPSPRLHVSIHKAIDFDDPKTQAALIAYGKAHQIKVTIADPIRSVSAAVDQGPRELKPLAQFLRRYMRETGSIWILGHHDVKPTVGKADDRAKPHRASGGGIFSIADSPIHVERVGTIEARTILTPTLYKGSTTPDPVIVELRTDDPKRPTWAQLQGSSATGATVADVDMHARIAEYLRNHPETSGSALARSIQRGKAPTLQALEHLHRQGLTTFVKRGQAQLWSILSEASL